MTKELDNTTLSFKENDSTLQKRDNLTPKVSKLLKLVCLSILVLFTAHIDIIPGVSA